MKKPSSTDSLLVFPCDFTIKVFGLAADDVEKATLHILAEQLLHFDPHAIQSRHSQQGKYIALNVTVTVDSQAQLDDLYQALSSSPHILMAL